MVFKERTFHGKDPRDEKISTPQSASADLEARAADFLASLADLDATQVSVVVAEAQLIVSGFVASARDVEAVEAALRHEFVDISIANRLRAG